jgi:hypothetical protein
MCDEEAEFVERYDEEVN